MAVCRAVPHWGASHGRTASLDRRFQPVRSKPDRLQGIWARPRLAASMQRLSRSGRDGPDSRSGRSGPRLTNPDRFAKNFPLAASEGVDQEPDADMAAAVRRGIPPFFYGPICHVRQHSGVGQQPVEVGGWHRFADRGAAEEAVRQCQGHAHNITIPAVQVNSDPTSSVRQYRASGTDKFYLATKADQTVSVFKDIGTSLSKLRVAHWPKAPRQTKKSPAVSAGLLIPEVRKITGRPG